MTKKSNTARQSNIVDANDVATLTFHGTKVNLPIVKSTVGEPGLDVKSFGSVINAFCYDSGFLSTASCTSKITYVDGLDGVLRHRGYDIQDLSAKKEFIDVIYLILFGELPSADQRLKLETKLVNAMTIPESVKQVVYAFDTTSHPMAIMMSGISCLSSIYEVDYNPNDIDNVTEHCILSIAKVITLGAFVFRFITKQKEIKVEKDLPFIDNCVRMMFGGAIEQNKFDILKSVFNKILILHADHEDNASTSTVRFVASTDSSVFASVVAGFAALWGPLHGGANEAVIHMLEQIQKPENIPMFLDKAKDKSDPFRLMGFGHRVYKNYDPRADVLKSSCTNVLKTFTSKETKELLDIAKNLEAIALKDQYFIDRKLFPNVDFYSGIIYKSLGIPSRFFTVIFGMSRVVGWVAHIREFLQTPERKISRPRQIYIGDPSRKIPK